MCERTIKHPTHTGTQRRHTHTRFVRNLFAHWRVEKKEEMVVSQHLTTLSAAVISIKRAKAKEQEATKARTYSDPESEECDCVREMESLCDNVTGDSNKCM